jgi:hypothetical protein
VWGGILTSFYWLSTIYTLKAVGHAGKGASRIVAEAGSKISKKEAAFRLLRDPAGARTQDPILKRDVLYLLSY